MLLGYTRCSTSEQNAEGTTTMAEQARVIRGLAMAKGIGQFELHIYEDIGVSGAKPLQERPAGAELYNAAKKGDIVCASKLDRMFRDALDAQVTYKEFKKRGVDLILFDMGVEPITGTGIGKCVFTIISAFADLERGRIAERMADGKAAKKQNGGHTGGLAPYGFSIVGEGREARLVENPKEKEIITEIARLHVLHPDARRKYAWFADELAFQGYTARNGKPFFPMQIKRIFELSQKIPPPIEQPSGWPERGTELVT